MSKKGQCEPISGLYFICCRERRTAGQQEKRSGANLTQHRGCSCRCGPLMAHGGRLPQQRQPQPRQRQRPLISTGSRRASRCGIVHFSNACIPLSSVFLGVVSKVIVCLEHGAEGSLLFAKHVGIICEKLCRKMRRCLSLFNTAELKYVARSPLQSGSATVDHPLQHCNSAQ